MKPCKTLTLLTYLVSCVKMRKISPGNQNQIICCGILERVLTQHFGANDSELVI